MTRTPEGPRVSDMATEHFDLLCIGSGPAGQRGAVQAAKLGKRAAVVERRRIVGGICLDTGTIPSKTLREAVIFYSSFGGRFDRRREIRAIQPRIVHAEGQERILMPGDPGYF